MGLIRRRAVGVQTLRVRPDALPLGMFGSALVRQQGDIAIAKKSCRKPGRTRAPLLVHFLVSSFTWIPSLGRNVIEASGVTLRPDTSRKRNFWPIVASTTLASISAEELPMHWRGPPPKGK